MHPFQPSDYGPVFAPLLETDRCRDLGPGQPDPRARDALEALSLEEAFGARRLADPTMGRLCCGALWLVHDYLDESHRISQSIDTATSAYWHGIMHRREPDASNAKYWFRQVGEHPVFGPLNEAARELARKSRGNDERTRLASQTAWDPFLFIDLCEASREGRSNSAPLLRAIQQQEWELLFDYCYRRALGE